MKNSYSHKIFVVDDDVFCLNLYEQQLRSLGYTNVSTFSNGYECVSRLNEKPDIVLLDHGMDHLDGSAVLKIIKTLNPDIYVVFLSGQEDVSVAVSTLKSGAFDYIVKSNQDMLRIKMVLDRITQVKASLNRVNRDGIKKMLSFFF